VAEDITESDLRITSKGDQIDATSVATKATAKLEFWSDKLAETGGEYFVIIADKFATKFEPF
jgi:hypothetical protein